MPTAGISRRDFIKTSTASVGAAALGATFVPSSAFGANERISLGIIGPGGRGSSLMGWAQKFSESENVEFTAVCDIWNERRESGAKRIKDWTGKDPRKCRTIADICALDDVDAVIIATADFQHCYHAAIAAKAGKDVYVEKPFGCDFEQIKKAYLTIKNTDRIVQMGTQARGSGKYFGARDFIKSGALGKITYGEIYEPLFQQRWRRYGAKDDLTEADTDWKEFLCYLDPDKYKWNPRHYREFRIFWPFSSGCFCQWMSHKIDLINLALDEIPHSAVALGGVYVWKDGRTNPDTVQCLLEYPSGCMVTYHMRLGNKHNGRGTTLYGTCGTTDLSSATGAGGGGTVTPVDPNDPDTRFNVDKSKRLSEDEPTTWESPPDVDHMQHWLQCLRTREQPRADVASGYAHAVATTLANMAYRNGCRMEYDHEKMEMRKAPIA
ncbi:MAG: Gfo/Idh/MocA family oxidoreductase [Armatimonadota bacterium]